MSDENTIYWTLVALVVLIVLWITFKEPPK